MFWKLLLTAVVILGAYSVIRARMGRGAPPPQSSAPRQAHSLSAGLIRQVAYGLIGLSLAGTGFYLFHDWDQGREILRVQVVNANTGALSDFRARRRDIEGRSFRTLEGQVVRLADVERMILTSAAHSQDGL